MANMTVLTSARADFVAKSRTYVKEEQLASIVAALDHVIAFTQREFAEAVPATAGDQFTVGFTFGDGGHVFWRAYPRKDDGAKIVVLPRLAEAMAPEARAALVAVLESVDPTIRISPDGILQISLRSFTTPSSLAAFEVFLTASGKAALAYRDSRDQA